jgi:hypothetical protein
MARTRQEIKAQMTNSFMSNVRIQELYELNTDLTFEEQFSSVSLESMLFDIFSFAYFILESLWDVFRNEINTAIEDSRVHTKNWYRNKALNFMFGLPVVPGTDTFNTDGLTPEEIEATKVVKQAAAVKLISDAGYGVLRLKVATKTGNALAPVPTLQFEALKAYMLSKVVDAGTQMIITTGNGDDLKLTVDVYYDPLVLSPTGSRLDGGNQTPVINAVLDYLQGLDFNGILIVSELQRVIADVDGVQSASIKLAASKYGGFGYESNTLPNVGVIDEVRIADSGYFKLDLDHTLLTYKLIQE